MKHIHAAAILAALSLAALPALAGVKYWDNPDFKAFDVGDYVQDGLVVNYDGIRNQGPDAPHDSAAMTWVNSANPGTYDMMRYSTNGTVAADSKTAIDVALTAWNNDASKGSWTDKGFVFDKGAAFYESAPFAIPKTYTIQSLVEATPGNQSGIGYIMCDYGAAHWSYCSLGIRSSQFNYGGGNATHTMYLVSGSIGKRPAIRGASAVRFSYVTAINNVNDGVLFSDTEAPWDAAYADTSYGHAYDSSKAGAAYTYDNGFCLGSHYPRTDEMLKGTLKNFRFYNRCLSDAEVLWNRVVDEARYFGRGREITVIPVTNVVESFTIAGVRDYHYAIDAEGQTFTAPSSKTVNGKRHVLSGYTLETWNGSAWGTPVAHDGESSYTATDPTALVRITWQYAEATGEGKLKTYDVDDYVAGAAIHFDGIRNAGATAAHDPTATTWANLGSVNMDLVRIKYGYGDLGGWDGDGYWFTDTPKFTNYTGRASWPQTYTVQVLLDANAADQQRTSELYVYSASYNRLAMAIYPTRNDIQLHTQKSTSVPYGPYLGGTVSGYVNGIVDANAKTAAIFSGTEAPTSGNNFKSYETMDTAVGTSGFAIGGYGGNASFDLVGKIKSIRFYFNKVLTEAELAQNRKVDEYRFFGRYVVTNVLVQSTYSYLDGYEKSGPYEVDGSYTFTAPETVTAPNGITYACDGYTVETQDGIGWAALASGAGNSYLYDTSAGTVRLTWKWKATKGLRTAADYSIDDLSPAGLALHYDGLLNQGVGVARSTTSTKWINLGSAGSSMNLSTQRKSGDTSAWGDKGYEYAGNTYFQSDVNTYVWGGSYSAQILADAKYADNKHVSGNYLAASTWNRFGMQVYGDKNLARSNVQGVGDDAMRVTYPTEDGIDYMTVIADAAAKVDYAFAGTKIPTGGSATAGYRPYTTQLAPYSNYFRLGGWGGGNNGQGLTGTIFTFRYYDRVLTEEELIRNRNVDSVRYFGELAVTNLVVEVSDDSVVNAVPAAGAYFVEGSYEFQATQRQNVPLAYRIQTWDETNDRWVTTAIGEGGSYTHVVTDPLAKTRILWREIKPFILIVR